jgi:integrase
MKNLENFESVQRWFTQLKKRACAMENGGMSKATKQFALMSLKFYTEYTKLNPDQIISDATTNINRHYDLIDKFWNKYPTKTTATIMFGYLKSFYHANRIPLTSKQPSLPTIRKFEKIPNNEEIRRICDVAPLQHASWILANSYMGLRIGAIPQLAASNFQTENWKEDKPLYPVFIPKIISGTFDYVTFIGHDAKTKLESYFENANPEKPWNYKSVTLIQRFKHYAYKAGVIGAPDGLWKSGGSINTPKGLCPLRPHALRKRVQTILEKKVPLNWVDHMLGHIPRGAQGKAYSRPNPEELYEAYLSCLPELEIYGHHRDSPILPAVEVQKMVAMEQIRKLPPQAQHEIKNLLAKVHTTEEMNNILQNIMILGKKK